MVQFADPSRLPARIPISGDNGNVVLSRDENSTYSAVVKVDLAKARSNEAAFKARLRESGQIPRHDLHALRVGLFHSLIWTGALGLTGLLLSWRR